MFFYKRHVLMRSIYLRTFLRFKSVVMMNEVKSQLILYLLKTYSFHRITGLASYARKFQTSLGKHNYKIIHQNITVTVINETFVRLPLMKNRTIVSFYIYYKRRH